MQSESIDIDDGQIRILRVSLRCLLQRADNVILQVLIRTPICRSPLYVDEMMEVNPTISPASDYKAHDLLA
jgi:hypothetical protein